LEVTMGEKMATGDPQFQWHTRDGKAVQAPTDARRYRHLAYALRASWIGDYGRYAATWLAG
jgi:hypothetical protein